MNGSGTGHDAALGARSPSEPAFHRTIRNDVVELCSAMESADAFLQENGIEEDTLFSVRLSLEEIVTNVIKYAYADCSPHDIHLDVRIVPGHVVLQVSDDGREYNPLECPPPDLAVPCEERPVGGLGVHLIKKLASRLDYVRSGGKNVLTAFIRRSPKD